MVGPTRVLSAAPTGETNSAMSARARRGRIALSMRRLLEGVRGMRGEDEGGLEEELVHIPGARAVQVYGVASLGAAVGVLVLQREAEKLRRPERDVWRDRSLRGRLRRLLRSLVAEY